MTSITSKVRQGEKKQNKIPTPKKFKLIPKWDEEDESTGSKLLPPPVPGMNKTYKKDSLC